MAMYGVYQACLVTGVVAGTGVGVASSGSLPMRSASVFV